MKKTADKITTRLDEVITEDHFFTYSEEEKQENQINKNNAGLIFSPAFIPFFPKLQKEHGLTDTETKLYGFIWFYLSSNSNRFYFTNEQLGEILSCSPDTVSRSMSSMETKGLIETSRKIKAGGGQIRFVSRLGKNPKSDSTIPTSRTRQFLQTNNNKINKNKIKNISINTNTQYGDEMINLLVQEFKEIVGFEPTDPKPRYEAYNLLRKLKSLLKERRIEPTPEATEKVILQYMRWIERQEWSSKLQTMATVRRKVPIFVSEL